MGEKTFLKRIFLKLLKKSGSISEFKVDKALMCRKSVTSGVCPNDCERCAWSSTR